MSSEVTESAETILHGDAEITETHGEAAARLAVGTSEVQTTFDAGRRPAQTGRRPPRDSSVRLRALRASV
ncbi:MAG: hypothetical protein A3H96_20230 [Acidobacteria bacterium RIFCSPLOWO2_02_FULL_67_36]|nr:MAG: hypothetical protein A3H96_20230 [Acidobacteria bacterium RIFCSPLOWO2_02_FULL_67_36]OFW23362.1 MAG: hypothetical protein A3G21_10735 [Acidobacteria bacterium RIFCSPLOWO2_12_FULL_66_21]